MKASIEKWGVLNPEMVEPPVILLFECGNKLRTERISPILRKRLLITVGIKTTEKDTMEHRHCSRLSSFTGVRLSPRPPTFFPRTV